MQFLSKIFTDIKSLSFRRNRYNISHAQYLFDPSTIDTTIFHNLFSFCTFCKQIITGQVGYNTDLDRREERFYLINISKIFPALHFSTLFRNHSSSFSMSLYRNISISFARNAIMPVSPLHLQIITRFLQNILYFKKRIINKKGLEISKYYKIQRSFFILSELGLCSVALNYIYLNFV